MADKKRKKEESEDEEEAEHGNSKKKVKQSSEADGPPFMVTCLSTLKLRPAYITPLTDLCLSISLRVYLYSNHILVREWTVMNLIVLFSLVE